MVSIRLAIVWSAFCLAFLLPLPMVAAPLPSPEEIPSESTSPQEMSSPAQWLDPSGQPLPFADHTAALDFLRHARVVSEEVLESGSTKPLKVLLERGRVQAHAVFRQVDVRKPRVVVDGQAYVNFHDSHIYECAAYEFSRWLNLDNIPPCVTRQLGSREGTLQLWIERAMTEAMRREKGHLPENAMGWAREKQTMRLFDALIGNIDRNQGNMLLDERGKLWFIDHTRSFGAGARLENLEKIVWCDRRIWNRLQMLDSEMLEQRLTPYLTSEQIQALRARGATLRQHLQQRIDVMGAGVVIFDWNVTRKADSGLEALPEDDLPLNTSLPDLGGR